MIYHLSLHTAGLIAGALARPLLSLLGTRFARAQLAAAISALPRRRRRSADDRSGLELLAAGDDGDGRVLQFRRPLLIVLPIGFFLVLRFVDEFLAVRALGILCLLAAEPLLDAAFLRPKRAGCW